MSVYQSVSQFILSVANHLNDILSAKQLQTNKQPLKFEIIIVVLLIIIYSLESLMYLLRPIYFSTTLRPRLLLVFCQLLVNLVN